MEGFSDLLWPLTAWHWLAIALILLAIEMAAGTFDLLWISVAAGVTALFTALAPGGIDGWQVQLTVFAVASVALIALGRTVFAGMRRNLQEHPTLNKRMTRTVGQRGVAVADFSGGAGRLKLGDTEWSAQTLDGSNPAAGTGLVVQSTVGNTLNVAVD